MSAEQLKDEFTLNKIIAVSRIAGELLFTICRDREPTPEHVQSSVRLAENIFETAEARVFEAPAKPRQRTRLEQLRFIRLIEKLRSNTLDTEERAELAELIEGGR